MWLLFKKIVGMKIEYQDRIEDYLFNRMADDERQSFEQDLEKDSELRDQYEFISMVKTALMLENIENDVNEWTKAYEEVAVEPEYEATGSGYECNTIGPAPRTASAPPRSSNRRFIYWISGIAALFIVGFFLFNNIFVGVDADVAFSPDEASSSGVAFSPRPQGVSTIRGNDVTTEILLAKADYQAALERIDSLEDEMATELMTLEREKDSRGAEQDRLAYKQEELMMKQEELSWLKVQALLGLNRKEEAIALLDKIRNSESEYKEQADSLYNVLKK